MWSGTSSGTASAASSEIPWRIMRAAGDHQSPLVSGMCSILEPHRAGPKGDIPPRCRNHRVPAADDTPTAAAASSLVSPRATSTKNRFDGRIDERATG
jgi:hypothetical protein